MLQKSPSPDSYSYYRSIIFDGSDSPSLESDSNAMENVTDQEIREHIEICREQIAKAIKSSPQGYLFEEIYNIVDKKGEELLKQLYDWQENALDHEPQVLSILEAIAKTDGSRPSFLLKQNEVDFGSSPTGFWKNSLIGSAQLLKSAAACVGRIESVHSPQGFLGTGFLLSENLLMTNRHVLQAIARIKSDKTWEINAAVTVNFGHEFDGLDEFNVRKIKQVLFASEQSISSGIDHRKLDLVVLELVPGTLSQLPMRFLSINPKLNDINQMTAYVIGYPGLPPSGAVNPTLESLLFQSRYGYKRLAPGKTIISKFQLPGFCFAHDATTLGGSSGSLVVLAGNELIVAGIHYGGGYSPIFENYGHVVANTLAEPDFYSGKSLSQILAEHNGL